MDDMRKAFEEILRAYVDYSSCEADGGDMAGQVEELKAELDQCLDSMLQAATLAERERCAMVFDAFSACMDCDSETERELLSAIRGEA